MTTSVFSRVRSIIVAELRIEPDRVTMNAPLRGRKLQADSLDLVNLVMAFAREFGVELRDEEFRKIVTVGDVVSYMERSLTA